MKTLNLRFVFHTVGVTLFFESLFMMLCSLVAIYYHDYHGIRIMMEAGFITAIAGGVMAALHDFKSHYEPRKKESFLVVTLSWLLVPLFGVLPYLISESIPNFTNAFFESVSGFTTTGSSILASIEPLPKYILFWRAQTHWIGGMGIIMLVIAIMPYIGIGGNQLMSAEGSITGVEKLTPRLIETAKRIGLIYLVLTILETILLRIADMGWFDAVCHSFATIATGGFSTQNDSVMGYSPAVQYILIAFMFLSGMNFALHYFGFHGRFKAAFKNEEFRTYLYIVVLVSVILTLAVISYYPGDIESAFRHALFQVVSIITATGFSSADYALWPHNAPIIIFALMFVGACVGSTGGGIKIARHLIVFKKIGLMLKKQYNPSAIYKLKYNERPVEPDIIRSVLSFTVIYVLTFVVGTFFMTLVGLDFESSSSSVITTLGGIGPGLGDVGPTNNFASVPEIGKYYLCFNMILGRLEIIPVLSVLAPLFYKV